MDAAPKHHPEHGSPFITVTGADEQTDVGALQELDAEIGLLYSTTPEGRNRFPGKAWIMAAAGKLPRVAIHVCGGPARAELLSGRLDDLVEHAQRIQINGILPLSCARYPEKTIITQHKRENDDLLAVSAPNHALLIDASGGRGISPETWHRPTDTSKQVGYAGGLGPDNIVGELERIRPVAQGRWLVDMEGKLRVNDWFCVELARECVWLFHEMNLSWRGAVNPNTGKGSQ